MIVAPDGPGSLRIVTQVDHAAAAGALAEQWSRPDAIAASVWPRFVNAVRRHDDGWRPADAHPALDPRDRPFGFKALPTPKHLAIWRRGLSLLRNADPYVGLLASLHARWLYTNIAIVSAAHQAHGVAFLAQLDQQIDTAIAELSTSDEPAMRAAVEPETLALSRRLLTLLDAISLRIAGGLSFQEMHEKVAFGSEAVDLTVQASDGEMQFAPWPFRGEAFTLHLPARRVPDQPYASPVHAAAAMASTAVETVSVAVRPLT